ncbi:hypothetical protein NLM16_16545 [Bradyrhizobium brasilense]|nr:hypothetical protein [Bradyrhizobium brasilense]MCP3415715.1 hypothetical protein [Bradyrhizobium brasilense]
MSAARMAYMLEAVDWWNPQLVWRPQSAAERRYLQLQILENHMAYNL